MKAHDLIETAIGLAGLDQRRPTQANLRRAVSTAYYAVFHSLARTAADGLIGQKTGKEAWHQVYRALEHGKARSACSNKQAMKIFPIEIREFAETFVELQINRHNADYSYDARYAKEDAMSAIYRAARAIDQLKGTNIADRRRFVVHLLFKQRSS